VPLTRVLSPFRFEVSRLLLLLCATVLAPSLARAESKEACVSAYENSQLHRLHGRYVAARDALLVCVQTTCPNVLRADCLNWLPEVEASLPSLVFAVTDLRGNDLPDARVYVNGKLLEGWSSGRAQAFDPGVYTLRFEASGRRAEEQTLTVREAEKNRLVRARLGDGDEAESAAPAQGVTSDELATERAPRVHIPLTSYFLGGTSIVSLGAALYFGVSGKKEYDRLDKACAPTCRESQTQEGRRNYILADVTLGIGIAAGAAAVWVYFAQRDKPAAPSVTLDVGPQRAQVGWLTHF
jgi:hypothetical protein